MRDASAADWITGGMMPTSVSVNWTFSFAIEEDGTISNSVLSFRANGEYLTSSTC